MEPRRVEGATENGRRHERAPRTRVEMTTTAGPAALLAQHAAGRRHTPGVAPQTHGRHRRCASTRATTVRPAAASGWRVLGRPAAGAQRWGARGGRTSGGGLHAKLGVQHWRASREDGGIPVTFKQGW